MTLLLGFVVVAQLTAAVPVDSTYSSASLAAFVSAAARENRRPPAALLGYRGRVESELALLLRDTLGREHVAQVEQIAMTASWQRGSSYDLHVIGYRSQTVGVPYSALSFARSWTVPYLYGERLSLGVDFSRDGRGVPSGADSSTKAAGAASGKGTIARRARGSAPLLHAVHPLASDRDRYYRFTGGDTIAQLRSHGRVVPIVRVHVVPHFDTTTRASRIGAFEGEIDFDATRHQIVRMRGQFVTSQGAGGGQSLTLGRLPGLVAVAYVEFVNAEVDGSYWLPAFQRSEFQAAFAPLGPTRSVFRLVSRFADLQAERAGAEVAGVVVTPPTDAPGVFDPDTADFPIARRLSYAAGDSVSRYRSWRSPVGEATAAVAASDFDDLAPDVWRVDGPPRLDLMPTKLDDVFRYDRVEGAYTGTALTARFRDAAPGLTVRAYGGWAWREQTARGGASASLQRGSVMGTLRGERALATTNDFVLPLEGGTAGLATLIGGVDDQDYVDRRLISMGLTRALGSVQTAVLTAELGLGSDRREITRLERGLFSSARFRVNRGVDQGRYLRGAANVELHPDVTGVFLEPGVGGTLSYEIGRGDLEWQRMELVVSSRHVLGSLTLAGRAGGGVVLGQNPPPQALFEMGSEGPLPGYGYKEFAGDRAAAAGVLASYAFPLLKRPLRLVRSLVIPGIGPGMAAGIQSGWTEISARARESVRRLDPDVRDPCDPATLELCASPISRATNGIRATADIRLTLFGGLIGLGVARPVDRAARWKFAFRMGQEF